MSQLMKVLVHQVISTGQTGIQLVEPKGMLQPMPYKRLYMKICFWIMDGAAHKYCFSIKGDSGSRFCNLCKNVFVAKTNQDEEEDMEIMEVSSFTKVNQLDLATDTEIWSSWSRMTARKSTETASAFKKWEQATGITYSSHAILADPSLQAHFPPTSVLFRLDACFVVQWSHVHSHLQSPPGGQLVEQFGRVAGLLECSRPMENLQCGFSITWKPKSSAAQPVSCSPLYRWLTIIWPNWIWLQTVSSVSKQYAIWWHCYKPVGPSRFPTKTSNSVWKRYWLSGKNVVGTWWRNTIGYYI